MSGSVTSFRYPHFTQGRHPTFEMPPPSTIYGHICSAVGDYVEPEGLKFGYHFTHAGRFTDFKEHLHFSDPIQPFPFDRDLLFKPRLTLYLNRVDLLPFFQLPRYAVSLGRSQDLMTYHRVEEIDLLSTEQAYFEKTLLPLKVAAILGGAFISATMARYIDPRRRSFWRSYALLTGRAIYPPLPQHVSDYDEKEAEEMVFETEDIDLWVDPSSPELSVGGVNLRRAVWFHSFVDR